MTKLEELAEKHRFDSNIYGETFTFTIDQLRALIKELVGEPVAYMWLEEWKTNGYAGDCLSNCNMKGKTPLYEIPDEVMK